jgi:hypothetical protein
MYVWLLGNVEDIQWLLEVSDIVFLLVFLSACWYFLFGSADQPDLDLGAALLGSVA